MCVGGGCWFFGICGLIYYKNPWVSSMNSGCIPSAPWMQVTWTKISEHMHPTSIDSSSVVRGSPTKLDLFFLLSF